MPRDNPSVRSLRSGRRVRGPLRSTATATATRCALLAAIVVSIGACAGVTRLDLTQLGRGVWQRPDDVIAALALPRGARVADLGAGDGYFEPYLAEAVGASGRVYAVDVDAERVLDLEARFGRSATIAVVFGDYTDPKLPDSAIDLVLIVDTFHHLEDRGDYLRRLRTDLVPGGRVAVIEPDRELSGVLGLFLEDGHTSRASAIRAEMEAAGYLHLETIELLPVQVFEVFRSPGPVHADGHPETTKVSAGSRSRQPGSFCPMHGARNGAPGCQDGLHARR